jgi:DNA-binding XRE family transcriptional regulator
MNEVGQALSNQGRHAEAEEVHRETLTLVEKVPGKEHPSTRICRDILAHMLRAELKQREI